MATKKNGATGTEVIPASEVEVMPDRPTRKEIEAVDLNKVMRSKKALTAAEAEALTEATRTASVAVFEMYARLYHGGAWKVMTDDEGKSFRSWSAYFQSKFAVSHEHAYQIVRAGGVPRMLEEETGLDKKLVKDATKIQLLLIDKMDKATKNKVSRLIEKKGIKSKDVNGPALRRMIESADTASAEKKAEREAEKEWEGYAKVVDTITGWSLPDTIALVASNVEHDPDVKASTLDTLDKAIAVLTEVRDAVLEVEVLKPEEETETETEAEEKSAEEEVATV